MTRIKNVSVFVLAYSLWVVSMLVGYLVISKGRDALVSILVALTFDRYSSGPREQFETALQVRAADVGSLILMGIALIVMIVVLEHVYRMAAQTNQVWSRFSQVTLVEFAGLCIFELLIVLSSSVVQPLTIGHFIFPAIYLIAAALFYWLWRTIRAPQAAA